MITLLISERNTIMKAKRVKWKDRTLENDIKYGGFLSYRHLRIIAWACLIIAQVGVVLKLEAKLAPETANVIDTWNLVISIIGALPVPLFLLANLSTILQSRGDYKGLFIRYGGLAIVMYLLANFLVFHYGYRTLAALNPATTWGDASRLFGEILPLFGKTGYILNIFIDMLLVVLMFFFTNYEPRTKIFQGKRIYLFRLMVLLPIAYEIVGIILKYKAGMAALDGTNFWIPSPVFFLLPSKPPFIFAAFVFIVLGLKLSKFFYLKRKGHTKEQLEEHIQTKAHSLKISIGIAACFVIFALIDLVVILVLMFTTYSNYAAAYPDYTQEVVSALAWARIEIYEGIGFGEAIGLIIVAPLVLLFSYTKTHKNALVDTLIPVAGIALIALVLLEGCFEVLTLNVAAFLEKVREFANKILGGGGEESGGGEARLLLTWIRSIHL